MTAAARMFLILIFLVVSGCGKADSNSQYFSKIGFINDYAAVFSSEEAATLETELQEYEKETCHQIFILTVPALKGEDIDIFSRRTAEVWKIGQQIMKNGVLMVIAMEEGRVRIDVGEGFEFIVKDGGGEHIINQEMIPLFKEGKIAEGIKQGVRELKKAAREKTYPQDHRPTVCK